VGIIKEKEEGKEKTFMAKLPKHKNPKPTTFSPVEVVDFLREARRGFREGGVYSIPDFFPVAGP